MASFTPLTLVLLVALFAVTLAAVTPDDIVLPERPDDKRPKCNEAPKQQVCCGKEKVKKNGKIKIKKSHEDNACYCLEKGGYVIEVGSCSTL